MTVAMRQVYDEIGRWLVEMQKMPQGYLDSEWELEDAAAIVSSAVSARVLSIEWFGRMIAELRAERKGEA